MRITAEAIYGDGWMYGTNTHTHTHTSLTTLCPGLPGCRYQNGKTNLDFTEATDSEWQWHQLGHMQVCTSLQTDNHVSTPPLSFFTGRVPFLSPNQQCQSTVPNLMSLGSPVMKLWMAVQNAENGVIWGSYGALKVMGNAVIRQRAYDFLFEFNRIYVSIFYRFWDIASYLSTVADFDQPHLHLAPS